MWAVVALLGGWVGLAGEMHGQELTNPFGGAEAGPEEREGASVEEPPVQLLNPFAAGETGAGEAAGETRAGAGDEPADEGGGAAPVPAEEPAEAGAGELDDATDGGGAAPDGDGAAPDGDGAAANGGEGDEGGGEPAPLLTVPVPAAEGNDGQAPLVRLPAADEVVRPSLDGGEFFRREAFGFGGATFEALRAEAEGVVLGVWGWAVETLATEPAAFVAPVAALLLLAFLGFLLWRQHRRLVTRAWAVAEGLELEWLKVAWLRWAVRALVRAAGGVLIPAFLYVFSIMPVQGLFHGAPWTLGLTAGFLVFLVYRVLFVLLAEGFAGLRRLASEEAVAPIEAAVVSSLRFVMVFHLVADVLMAAGYREDVVALARTLTLGAATLLAMRFFLLRQQVLALLPEEGGARWQRFRGALARWFPSLIGLTVVLLLLWTLGFQQAASTILLRSWVLVALISGAALVQRWFVARMEEVRAEDNALVTALLGEVDTFARACIFVAFGALLLQVLGVLPPIVALLQRPLLLVGQTPLSVYALGKSLLFLVAGLLVTRVVRVVLEQSVYPRIGMEEGAGYALTTTVRYILLLVAGMLGLVTLGFDFASLALFAGALGVGIGFGLQDIARNVVSGLILLFGRSVQKGDFISVGDAFFGRVMEVGIRSVTILTPDRTEVVIPSSELVNGPITNWTHSEKFFRIHIPVGVSYKADPEQVREALLEAAERFPLAAKHPAPDVWLSGFGDNSVDMTLLIWVDASRIRKDEATGKVLFEVWKVLKERGVEIPFPQRDIHVRTVPEGWKGSGGGVTLTAGGEE